tara:strand:- start:1203 stop:1688 length:486 start_codon:yes stop_codon:yes gene_type:complete
MSNYELTKQEVVWLMENSLSNAGTIGVEEQPTEASNVTITGEMDHEVSMASQQLKKTAKYSQSLSDRMSNMGEENLPAWIQAKITKASDYISKVYDYLDDYIDGGDDAIEESIEGKVDTASHAIEIDIIVNKSDMKKIHDGETVILKDTNGKNSFTVNLKT